MSQSTVEEILVMIDSLPPRERELLDRRLAERLEADWRAEAGEARRNARNRGIAQETIDEAVHMMRYGQ